MTDSLIIFVLVLLAGALVALVISGIKSAKAAAEEIENDNVRYAVLQLLDVVAVIVGSLNQTIVKPLKDSPTLNFDKEAQKEVLETAKKAVKKNLDDKSLEILADKYEDLDAFLGHTIEAEVYKQKIDDTVLIIDEDVETI